MGGLVEGRARPHAAHARHRPPLRRRRLLRRAPEHLRAARSTCASLLDQFQGDVDLALAAYNAGPRTPSCATAASRPTGRRAATCRRCRRCSAGFAAAAAPAAARRLLRAARARCGPARPRARPPGAPARSSRPGPATYYRWRDERGVTHVAEAPPARGHRVLDRAGAGLRPCPTPSRAARSTRASSSPTSTRGASSSRRGATTRPSAQLEEAYLLRPRDPRVLNLLGLVYFRGEKLDKAEEVYRKLIAESPDAHTLHYNLGLICFKLNRLEDAESRVPEGARADPGQPEDPLLPRLDLRAAAALQGRDLPVPPGRRQPCMVQRLQGRMGQRRRDATAPPGARQPPRAPPPGPARASAAAPPHARPGRCRRPRHAARPRPEPKRCCPGRRSEELAAGRRAAAAGQPCPDGRGAPPGRGLRRPALQVDGHACPRRTKPRAAALPPPRQPPAPASEVFRGLEKGLMEVDFSGKVFIKQGTIYSYSGNLTFWVKEKRPGAQPGARHRHRDRARSSSPTRTARSRSCRWRTSPSSSSRPTSSRARRGCSRATSASADDEPASRSSPSRAAAWSPSPSPASRCR